MNNPMNQRTPNQIPVTFQPGETVAVAETSVYQWDRGIELCLSGSLEWAAGAASVFEAVCSFDTQENGVPAAVRVDPDPDTGTIQVSVPDIVLTKGVQVFCYLSLTTGSSADGGFATSTVYEVRLPVLRRAKTHDYEAMADSDRSAIDALLSAVNTSAARLRKFENLNATVEIGEPDSEPGVSVESMDSSTNFSFSLPQVEAADVEATLDKGDLYLSVNSGGSQYVGRVTPVYRGEFDSAAEYLMLNIVREGTRLYIKTKEGDGDILPDVPASCWEELAGYFHARNRRKP